MRPIHTPTLRPAPTALRCVAACLASVFALAAGPAFAQEGERDRPANYFEFQGGISHIPNQTIDGNTGTGSIQPDEVGFNIGGALGRHINDMIRAELAFTYREGDVDQAGFASGQQADGKSSLFAAMANVYAEFADLPLGGITPWVGVGIGVGEYKVDIFQETAGDFDVDDADVVFVYNAMVGASVPLTDVATLNFGYRYIAIAGEKGSGAVIAPSTRTQEVEDEFDSHEGIIGVRFRF